MSDPLDRLRDLGQSDLGLEPPSADEIKSRAKKIQARRTTALVASGGTAALVMVVALSFIALRPGTTGLQLASEPAGPSGPGAQAEQQAPEESFAREVGTPAQDPFAGKAQTTTRSSGASEGSGDLTPLAGGVTAGQAKPIRVEIELSSGTVTLGQPVTMKLRVCNDSANEVEVQFNTAQRYDFEVTDPRSRNVVWRWSHDKAFAQVTGTERFRPGCRVVGEETWNGSNEQGQPLSPGRYEIAGILTSNPPQRTPAKTICVTTCG